MSRFRYLTISIALTALFTTIIGCEPVAHLSWSPDGKQAAYFVPGSGKPLPGNGFVLDDSGKISADLGSAFGSFAWSSDSKTIYFGGFDEKPDAAPPIRKWLVDAEDQPTANATNEDIPAMSLNRWQNGTVEKLASLGNRYVLFVHLSADQKWAAIVTFAKKTTSDRGHGELFVYSVDSKKLYEVSDFCSPAACFTGANKIVYAEADREEGASTSTGEIVEATLDESSEQLSRTPLIDVLWQKVSDIQPVQDGLLFTTSARAFPAKAIAETPGKERPVSLYHWTRANGGIAAAVDDTGPLFLPSPDGKRILYIDISPPTGNTPGKQELFVMNSNGSDSHLLLDLSAFSQLPMWPSWHGNDAISFIDLASIDLPSEAGKDPRIAFNIVEYKLSASDSLQFGKKLSEGWPMDRLPSMKKSDLIVPIVVPK